MNLFLDYQKRILKCVKSMEKKGLLKIPYKPTNIVVELPPKNQNADLSCNIAMIFANVNKIPPIKLAGIIKIELLKRFKEFNNIEIADPGFINITFNISFWKKYLKRIIQLDSKYGSSRTTKKKYNIEFVSANPTGPFM